MSKQQQIQVKPPKEQPYLPQQVPAKVKDHKNTNWVDTFTFILIGLVVAAFVSWLIIDNYEARNNVDTRSKGWTLLVILFVFVFFINVARETKIHEMDWIGGFDMLRIDFYYFDPDFFELTNDEQVMEKIDPLLREQEKWWPVEYILDVKANIDTVRDFLYDGLLEKTAMRGLLCENEKETQARIEDALKKLYKASYSPPGSQKELASLPAPDPSIARELTEAELQERIQKAPDDVKARLQQAAIETTLKDLYAKSLEATEPPKELSKTELQEQVQAIPANIKDFFQKSAKATLDKMLEDEKDGEDEYFFGYARFARPIKWKIKRGKAETIHTSRDALFRMPRPVRETFLWGKEYVTSGGYSLKHTHAEKINLIFKETNLVDLPRYDVNDCGYYRKVKKLVKVDEDSKSARAMLDSVCYIHDREMVKIAADLKALAKNKAGADEEDDKAAYDDMQGLTHESLVPMIKQIQARMGPKKEEAAVFWTFLAIFIGLFLLFMFLWLFKVYPA